MQMSEQITEIAKALVLAQKGIGAAHKESNNPFFKSNYADLTSVMDACKGPLNDSGISIIQGLVYEAEQPFMETMLIHESGQYFSCKMKLIANKNDMQAYGSAITYARRYTLQSLACVGAVDDDGNAATKNPRSAPNKPKTKGVFICSFGKFKGMALNEIKEDDLKNYVLFLEKSAKEKGKTIDGVALEFINAVDKYFE